MIEPPEADYSRQVSGDTIGTMDSSLGRKWIAETQAEADRLGCAVTRMSWNDERKMLLIEGWNIEPEHYPEPRLSDVAQLA